MFIDVDDTIIDVHGYQKGSGYGYSGGPRTQCLAGHVSTQDTAPAILAQRLRRGATNSPAAPSAWSPTPSPPSNASSPAPGSKIPETA